MTGIAAAAPALGMLGALACVGGGAYLLWTGQDRRKGVLLLVMAAVLVFNVAIWTV